MSALDAGLRRGFLDKMPTSLSRNNFKVADHCAAARIDQIIFERPRAFGLGPDHLDRAIETAPLKFKGDRLGFECDAASRLLFDDAARCKPATNRARGHADDKQQRVERDDAEQRRAQQPAIRSRQHSLLRARYGSAADPRRDRSSPAVG